jgi:flagellar hook-length control protein FliK
MSALNLLSVIAPVVPNVPQGSSGKAESGFKNLMATLSDEEAPAVEARTDAKAVPGFVVVPATTPETLPPAVGSSADGKVGADPTTFPPAPGVADGDPDGPRTFPFAPDDKGVAAKTDAGPTTFPPAPGVADGDPDGPRTFPFAPVDKGVAAKTDAGPTTFPPAPGVADGDPDGPRTFPLARADKGVGPRTNEPQVQPAVSDLGALRDQMRENQPAHAAAAAAAAKGVDAQIQVQAGTPAAPAPSAPPPVAPPPPLRALAERTSRPLEAPVGKTGDGPRTADPVPAATGTASAAAPVPATQPAGSAEFAAAAAAAARALADGGEAEAPSPDRLPPGEAETVQTQGAATARETALSQLSRVTIEATAQIAAQILRRLEGRSTRFEMALTPDELGRVDVKLDIDSEGRLNARLAFDNPAAATDLRGRADELRRQLEDAGFHLSKDAFEFAQRDSGSSAFDRGQDSRNDPSRAFAAASRLNTEIDVDQPPGWLKLSLSPSGVDMKV